MFYKTRVNLIIPICLSVVIMGIFNLDFAFALNVKETIENTNNILVSEGFIVENFIYKNEKIKTPVAIASDVQGRLYILNKEGEIFIIEKK